MPEQPWWALLHGKRVGQLTSERIEMMLLNGEMLPSDLVWKAGMPTWARASETEPFNNTVKSLPPPVEPPPLPLKVPAEGLRGGPPSLPAANLPQRSGSSWVIIIALGIVLGVLLLVVL